MKFNCDPAAALRAAKRIKILLLDVDGVLTGGYLPSSGPE